tara:strand:- start:2022 stop:2468 length:447 start_codon:yes stop_codon:yes gene_type:complete
MIGYIYEINIGNKKYIGSTIMKYLCNRQQKHNQELKQGEKNTPLFEECRKQNITKIICELIEKVEIENINELRTIEQKYINELKPQLNMFKAIRTEEDNRIDSCIRQKKYTEKNKEKLKLKRSELVKCPICDIQISRGSLTRHKKRKH